MRCTYVLLLLIIILFPACIARPDTPDSTARIAAARETAPVGTQGDAADDPALWHHPDRPESARILATNKQAGLVVFALDGTHVQSLLIGRLNNVDLRQDASRPYDLAIASNDQINAISVFRIDRVTGQVAHSADHPTGKTEPYGICLARDAEQDLAGVTYKDGTVQIWSLGEAAAGARLVKTVKLASKSEGCVFDETAGTLFVGEEALGVWAIDYRTDPAAPVRVDHVLSGTGLAADVEGVSLWRGENGEGWLIVSAQGADRFIVYDRKAPYAARGAFTVTEGSGGKIDAVTHTDGLDISSRPLPGFPRGLLIVQDDGNPRKEVDQNFKLVSWTAVEMRLGLPELTPAQNGANSGHSE